MTPRSPCAHQPGSRRLFGMAIAIATVLAPLCLPSVSYGQVTFEVLKGFEAPFLHGDGPYAGLIQAADGNFYGTTQGGGAFGRGTIFRLDTAGTLTTLHHFAGGSEGDSPYAGVIQAADGTFYGTTLAGGAFDSGTIYRLDASGTLTTLHSFYYDARTYAGLIQAADGSFYGANYYDRTAHDGAIFKLDAAGTFTIVHRFSAPAEGANPFGSLIQGPDGSLYGTTIGGGAFAKGTVFRFDAAGTGTLTTLHSFTGGDDGDSPWADLTMGSDGSFYGTTVSGGAGGTVFKVDAAGTFTTLHGFSGDDGLNPAAHVIQAADGNLYGTTLGSSAGVSILFKLDSAGTVTTLFSFTGEFGGGLYGGIIQATDGSLYGTTAQGPGNGGTLFKFDFVSFTTLYSFWDTSFDGANPYGGLSRGVDGILYGTTRYGGVSGLGSGRGTVFSVDSAGLHTRLHSFEDYGGAYPQGPVIHGADGSLYGSNPVGGGTGAGVVFRLDSAGTLTAFHSFTGADGYAPHGGVIQSTDGSFYGTATSGGSSYSGTIFKLGPTGSLSAVHSFTGGNGAYPDSAPIQASDGNVYGTTVNGGIFGRGTVYKLDAAGTLSTLHHFTGDIDGGKPLAGLIEAADGRLVGTTREGGAGSAGTVFKIDMAGNLTTLHSFSGPDGAYPIGGVIEGTDGSLYGTTSYGGTPAFNAGTIFKLEATGTLTTLHQFSPASEGRNSYGFLTQGADGKLYGTTYEGGPNGGGTVFRLTLPTAPAFTLSLSKALISGCLTAKATVTLMAPAPADGTVVSLSSDNPHASVPATVKVAAGATMKAFSIKTTPVAAIEAATIGASIGSTHDSQTLTLKPMGVKSLTLSKTSVVGGSQVSGSVKLECQAGPAPITVTLTSSKPATAWPVPGTVTLPVGTAGAPFVVTTVPVAAAVKAAIKATTNGVTKSKTLTVKPPS